MASSVDFDYNGPPVNVSNGMAVQLVSQFGLRNAWLAFLKLRGMKMTNEEAEAAQQSFGYFRNKIGHLRRQFKAFGGVDVDGGQDGLMDENFDNFLASPNALELREDAPEYVETGESEFVEMDDAGGLSGPTTASLLEVVEKSRRSQQKQSQQNSLPAGSAVTNLDALTKNNSSTTKEGSVAAAGGVGGGTGKGGTTTTKTTTSKNSREREDDPETKQVVEKLLAAKEEIARRHAETIDDVVSLVMEKIRNNQPFEGELAAGSTVHTGPPKSHHKRAGTGASQRMTRGGGGGAQRKATEMVGQQHVQHVQQQQQFAPGNNGIGTGTTSSSSTAAMNTFGHIPPGQSYVLLHNPATGAVHQQMPQYSVAPPGKAHGQGGGAGMVHHQQQQQQLYGHPQMGSDQVTILGNFSDMIQSSTGAISTAPHPMGTHPKSVAVGQQQQQYIGQMMDTAQGDDGGGTSTAAIPIELAIQQNMTVQELIQTLKAQSRHQNAQIILHHNASAGSAPAPTTASAPSSGRHQQQQQQRQLQQETPDSSSQEAYEAHRFAAANQPDFKGIGMTAADVFVPAKKGRKRKGGGGEEVGAVQQPGMKPQGKLDAEVDSKAAEVKAEDLKGEKKKDVPKGKKPSLAGKEREKAAVLTSSASQPATAMPKTPSASSAAEQKQQQKQQEHVDELDTQLRKANKQLASERNKSAGLKKRVEKLQSELDKALDSIQLLQIDLACQKTDNNNLIAENIALKAENQQLRSKGQRGGGIGTSSSSTFVVPTTSSAASMPQGIVVGQRGRKKKPTEMAAPEQQQQQREEVPKAKSGRGRKPTTAASTAVEEPPPKMAREASPLPYTLSSELGRRQSKRICVARNQFMKNLF